VSGAAIARSPVCGVEVRAIGCGVSAPTVAQWVDHVYFEFGRGLAFWRRLAGVRVIEPNHPEAPARMRYSATNTNPAEGLYDPATRLVWVSSQADVWAVMVHEIGHHLQYECRCLPDGSPGGRALLALYGALTNRPSAEWVEWMATDFRRALFESRPFPGAVQFFHAVAAAGGY
jgi:hypothetical protein